MLKIGIGSKTSTGGAVLEGNEGLVFDGLVASSVGHKASCPKCKKGIGPIVAVGPRTVQLPAGPAARAGDYVACGCPPGSNVLLAEGTVHIGAQQGGVYSGLSTPPGRVKTIDSLYWSFGDNATPLADTSRFYVDMNLHAETTGYQPGEMLQIQLSGALDLTVQGQVDDDGKVFIPAVLRKQQLELEGVV